MQYDGSINIDTRVDTKGVNKGTKSITSSFGNVLRSIKAVGAALGLAFSGAAIFNFIKKTLESFDLMNSSVGGKIKELKNSFEGLKGALANTVLALFTALQPYIIAAVTWLTQMLNTLTAIITALFGVQDLTANAAANTDEMNKNSKGALASFDQINVLGGGKEKTNTSILPNVTIPADLLAKVEDFKKKMLEFLAPVIAAWNDLKNALEPLGKTIWEGLQWAWENILIPLGSWVITDVLPAFMELLAGAATVLNSVLIALAPVWQKFYNEFLLPLAKWAGDTFINFLNWLAEKLQELAVWINENPQKFVDFIAIIGILGAVFKVAGAIIALFGITVSLTVLSIIALFAALAVAIYLLIAHWDELSTTVKQLMFIIQYYIAQAFGFIVEKFTNMRDVFSDLLFSIGTTFMNVFNGIRDFVVSIINDIIGIVNDAISGIVSGFLGATGNLVLGGGGNNKSNNAVAPRIPRLATGAVIPPNAQFAAVLGDQKNGRNLEAPEGLIRQIIREEMGNNSGNLTVQMPVYLDSEKIYDGVKKVEIRRGPSLVSGGVS